MDLEIRLDQILTELEQKKQTVISELKDSPDGRIMRTRSHQRPLILQVIGHGDDRKRVCITKDRVLQQKLARKDILCRELEVLELQSNALKGAIEQISRNGRFDRMRFAIENFGWLSDEELQELFLSEGTIKTHVHNIMKKTGASSRDELKKDFWSK